MDDNTPNNFPSGPIEDDDFDRLDFQSAGSTANSDTSENVRQNQNSTTEENESTSGEGRRPALFISFVVYMDSNSPPPFRADLLTNLLAMALVNRHGATGDRFPDILDMLLRQHQPRSRPVPETVLNRLPSVNISKQQITEKAECPVCKDMFEESNGAIKLPCNHFYHRECIVTWFKTQNTCPLCRYELPLDDEEYEQERKKRMASRNICEDELTTEKPLAKPADVNNVPPNSNSSNNNNHSTAASSHTTDISDEDINEVLLTCGHQIEREFMDQAQREEISRTDVILPTPCTSFLCPLCQERVTESTGKAKRRRNIEVDVDPRSNASKRQKV